MASRGRIGVRLGSNIRKYQLLVNDETDASHSFLCDQRQLTACRSSLRSSGATVVDRDRRNANLRGGGRTMMRTTAFIDIQLAQAV